MTYARPTPPLTRWNGTVVAQTDTDLAALVAAWPTLPEPIRAGILAMVKAATGQRGGR